MEEDQQIFGEFVARVEVDLPQRRAISSRVGGRSRGPGQDDAQGVDVAAARHAAEQRGLRRVVPRPMNGS